jgi:aldehyde dehydrogenase (NAD+)
MATETRVAGQPGMMIGGERRPAKSGKTFPTYDPATGQVLAEVAAGSKADVDEAVGVARAASKSKTWGRIAPAERSQLMWRFAQKIRDHHDELAKLESQDVGKPLREAKGDASVCARYFEFYAGVADKIDGHTIPMPDGFTAYTVREPMGVSAHIIPWNYPLQIAGRGVGAALACGNTVVVKPSSEAPLSILRLSEIALEAGLPPGVFNVVTGSATDVGESLAGHPGVNQVTFTGSISAGVRVMQLAAENAVPVQL